MPKKTSAEDKSLVNLVYKILEDHKAEEIITVDLAGKTTFADYMVIASGTSQRHLQGLATHLQVEAKKQGYKYMEVEGSQDSAWVLVDLGSVIIHLFRPEMRELYDLEGMWESASKTLKRRSV